MSRGEKRGCRFLHLSTSETPNPHVLSLDRFVFSSSAAIHNFEAGAAAMWRRVLANQVLIRAVALPASAPACTLSRAVETQVPRQVRRPRRGGGDVWTPACLAVPAALPAGPGTALPGGEHQPSRFVRLRRCLERGALQVRLWCCSGTLKGVPAPPHTHQGLPPGQPPPPVPRCCPLPSPACLRQWSAGCSGAAPGRWTARRCTNSWKMGWPSTSKCRQAGCLAAAPVLHCSREGARLAAGGGVVGRAACVRAGMQRWCASAWQSAGAGALYGVERLPRG